MFEDLTVPLCGFYDIRHTKSSLKKTRFTFTKHGYRFPLMISPMPNTGIYDSLPKPL